MDYVERIKQIGIKKGFLANRIGVSPEDFSRWLGGRYLLSKGELAELENIIHDIEVVFDLCNLQVNTSVN